MAPLMLRYVHNLIVLFVNEYFASLPSSGKSTISDQFLSGDWACLP